MICVKNSIVESLGRVSLPSASAAPSGGYVHTAHPLMPPFGWRRRGHRKTVTRRENQQYQQQQDRDPMHYQRLLQEIEGLPYADASCANSSASETASP